MNRWNEQAAMLSSIISEKTVKKGAPFSHTRSLFHLFVYPCPSVAQSGGPDKAFNGIPLHVRFPSSLPPISFLLYSSFIFFAFHLLLAITLTCTCPPPPPPPPLFLPTSAFIDLPYVFLTCRLTETIKQHVPSLICSLPCVLIPGFCSISSCCNMF